jgi:uncharacterized hydrophobic protein (TIGR00271 family)
VSPALRTVSRIRRLQDALLRVLGHDVEGRSVVVANMLHRDANEATAYWLQLVVSVGIATLGLVVGSSAVVIGAMLVAPLMGPIVGLAMGLAAGSPFLVLRTGGRIVLSVAVAVAGAAAITLMLPFHELNSEIAARTSPTLLDLITAGFCAVIGVYASLRAGAGTDVATTAAGTSISISLVPPLCASGYGFGISSWALGGGAALLFLTNLVAIVVVGTVAFVAAGFNRVDVVALEHHELERGGQSAPIARNLARRLSRVFESRWGSALRFLMPFALLAAVYLPLRRALDEVAWEVRVRAAIRLAIEEETARVVQSRARVERHEVEIVLVVVGKTRDAEGLRERMDKKIRAAAGVAPHLEILAVPDAHAIAGIESSLLTPKVAATAVQAAPSPSAELDEVRSRIRRAIEASWPSASAGEPSAIDVGTMSDEVVSLRIVHLGTPLSADGAEAVQLAVESVLERKLRLLDVAVPAAELTRKDGDLAFIANVSAGLRDTREVPGLSVCVVRPENPAAARQAPAAETELAAALKQAFSTHPRVHEQVGESWSVRFVRGDCVPPAAPAAPAASAAPAAP